MSSRRTKIICTIGPAVSGEQKLLELARAGMNVARLNFSHGAHDSFAVTIAQLRQVELKLGRPIGILADLQGPKIRVAQLDGGSVELVASEKVKITSDQAVGGRRGGQVIIPVGYREFVKDVQPGSRVLLDDGLMELEVLERDNSQLECRVVTGGVLFEHKGVNVPEASFSALAITDKDYADILFCVEQNVEFIALSFVRTAQEVRHLKDFVTSRQTRIKIISKIEKRDALQNLDAIIDASDGIMLARGDLGVEIGNECVPVWQKRVVRRCNVKAKPVIVATQMLMSMIDNPRPSRAEASDVANAIVDGADAVMLSNETAVGKYPIESVRMMSKIVEEMESEANTTPILYNEWDVADDSRTSVALLQSAVRLASVAGAKLIAVITESGYSALVVSKCRPQSPIIAVTPQESTYRQMALNWGVKPHRMQEMGELVTQTTVFDKLAERLRTSNLCQPGDKIVITVGLPKLTGGSTNTIQLHTVI